MKLTTTKCDRISEQSQKESNSYSKETASSATVSPEHHHSREVRQPEPNSSFLWNNAKHFEPSNSAEEDPDELYDDVKNCHTYSDIPCYDDVKNVTECEPVYVSSDDLSDEYDDIKNRVMDSASTLVTATPAVIMEDQCDSLSVLYDDIRRDGGDDVTLYESIAGSLLRLDRLQVGHMRGFNM